jgi:predicted dehydrogenase
VSAPEVRVAIVGGGLMGREIAAAIQRWPALVDHPVRPRLVAVADLNPAALEWFRGIDTVTSLVTDYRDLLADPDIDVVYIAVRHDLHEQLYVDTIRAGKSLLAEKPFGIDDAAAARILAASAEHPESFVRVSSEMPFFPGAQWALRYLASGAIGRIIEARSAFLHSSDLDPTKPLNWKRQAVYCGAAGVMNDLGLHAWHLPLRLGWMPRELTATLQNIVTERPGPTGALEPCDTWDNAVWHGLVDGEGGEFSLTVETKRISPGDKNSWEFDVIGMTGGVRFSTSDPVGVWVFENSEVPGIGREQGWRRIESGSQSVWPTVTGGIFEAGFSDAILQMWAAFLAERAGSLGERFGCATPEEAVATHRMAAAALRSWNEARRVAP